MHLTAAQIQEFRDTGVVIPTGVLTAADLQPVIGELSAFLDARARALLAGGKLRDLAADQPFDQRYATLYAQCPEIGAGMDIMEARGPHMFAFLRNPNLLDAVESLLGPELTCNPIQHVRAKIPDCLTDGKPSYFNNVPWHQDGGVTMPEADPSDILTFWIPLVDATAENGCMEVMPGAFRRGQLDHQAAGGTSIVPEQFPELPARVAACPKGGMVIMHKHTPHRGLPNRSDRVRWTIDLRYQPTGTPTGRPWHPAFVVRSRRNPASVLTDHATWCRLWREGLERGKGQKMHRLSR